MAEVSLIRLYGLRAMYLFMSVGIGLVFWPDVISHTNEFAAKSGIQYSLLAGIGAMAALGVRYPLQMLPVLLFEFFWKALWMIAMAWPLWAAHAIDAGTSENLLAVGMGVVLCPIVIPWRYVFANYVGKPGDRWS